jgi:hypothetical protein
MYDHAREYLEKVVPWPEGDEGYVNIHWTFHSENFARPGWGGRACRTVDEAIKALEFALKGDATRDIYACMSQQSSSETRTTAKGWTYQTPIRLQANAVALKSLFLDVDCKGTNGYPSQKDATVALAEFLKAAALPRPSMIVSSGGGLHVYWTLDRAITPAQWKPLALALAEATKRHNLLCDTQVTIDSARLLRVPDTFNRKTDTPRPVRIAGTALDFDYPVEKIEEALQPFLTIEPSNLPARVPVTGKNAELSAGIEASKAPPADLNELAKVCGFVGEAVATGGKDNANPLWNLTTLIAVFCSNGREAAHLMAQGHAGYTRETTEELFDRKERDREDKGLGWPGCKTISATGCTACQKCPHFSEGRTPFHFIGPPPVVEEATKPLNWDLPQGYTRDSAGIVSLVQILPDGSNLLVPVLDYPMKAPWLQRDPWTLNFTTITYRGHEQQIAMPFSDSLVSGGARGVLGRQGIAVFGGKRATIFEEFYVSWIKKLQDHRDAVIDSAPFGWQTKNGKVEGFIFGSRIWTPNGDHPSAVGDPVLLASYMPSGEPHPWYEACKMVTAQNRPALNAVIAAAFAAPLVRPSGREGVMLSLYSSGSGLGKTTAMRVAQAVWGHPVKAMQGLDDTSLSVLNKMGQLRSLPMFWDEMKTEDDTKRFVTLMFRLTSGKERNRMRSDVTQRDSGTWQTMLISASNESIIDYVVSRTKMTDSGLKRAFEFEVPPGEFGQIDGSDADQIIARLNDNYGHVGLAYAKWLGENYAKIEEDITALDKQVAEDVEVTQNERFWRSTVTVILLGARYANQLGFTEIDEDGLKEFMFEALRGMRKHQDSQPNDMSKSHNIENVLAQYLNAMRTRHTLFTNRIHISKGKPSKDSVKVVRANQKIEDIFVQIGVDDKIMRISSTQFTEWMQERGYSRNIFTRALEKEYTCKVVNGRIGGGTEYASAANEYLLEIQLSGTPLANFLDEQ